MTIWLSGSLYWNHRVTAQFVWIDEFIGLHHSYVRFPLRNLYSSLLRSSDLSSDIFVQWSSPGSRSRSCPGQRPTWKLHKYWTIFTMEIWFVQDEPFPRETCHTLWFLTHTVKLATLCDTCHTVWFLPHCVILATLCDTCHAVWYLRHFMILVSVSANPFSVVICIQLHSDT